MIKPKFAQYVHDCLYLVFAVTVLVMRTITTVLCVIACCFLFLCMYLAYCLRLYIDFNYSVCNSPPPPENGYISSQDGNTTAIYTCKSGFTIDGPSVRTCQSDGTGWTETDPICGNYEFPEYFTAFIDIFK